MFLKSVCYNLLHYMIPKVTRTFVRTDAGMSEYMRISEERKEKGIIVNPFLKWKEMLVKEFTHWAIMENEFPYDAIATTSHMLTTKRVAPFNWNSLTAEEKEEFEIIKNGYAKENYDVLWENLPRGITIPIHFHLHLLVLKREEI